MKSFWQNVQSTTEICSPAFAKSCCFGTSKGGSLKIKALSLLSSLFLFDYDTFVYFPTQNILITLTNSLYFCSYVHRCFLPTCLKFSFVSSRVFYWEVFTRPMLDIHFLKRVMFMRFRISRVRDSIVLEHNADRLRSDPHSCHGPKACSH